MTTSNSIDGEDAAVVISLQMIFRPQRLCKDQAKYRHVMFSCNSCCYCTTVQPAPAPLRRRQHRLWLVAAQEVREEDQEEEDRWKEEREEGEREQDSPLMSSLPTAPL